MAQHLRRVDDLPPVLLAIVAVAAWNVVGARAVARPLLAGPIRRHRRGASRGRQSADVD
ncbi:hypothetical protein ABIE78_003880 [Sinorhizobium fredii]|uniref:Transmembrane protein n=1 Tax=Sinorhizobium fredii (strain USDA 257) TaxID=1185652 RepID=I3X369_SINF2|nr:hypothetical protein [Sinorhizobium fredii]AFL50325.1 hypothetical protein USDA257_c17370 [Sinorhizobium fredii USDA 257]